MAWFEINTARVHNSSENRQSLSSGEQSQFQIIRVKYWQVQKRFSLADLHQKATVSSFWFFARIETTSFVWLGTKVQMENLPQNSRILYFIAAIPSRTIVHTCICKKKIKKLLASQFKFKWEKCSFSSTIFYFLFQFSVGQNPSSHLLDRESFSILHVRRI